MNSKLPNQITVANGSGRSGSAIQKNDGKTMLAHNAPYLARQLSAFGPTRVLSQRVNQCCVSLICMVMQGEYTEVYPSSGKRRPYVQREGGVLYFLTPKCLRRGYKL
jgi:hypothetical protein